MGTNFLFVNPSFANGMARTIDLFGTFSNYNTDGILSIQVVSD